MHQTLLTLSVVLAVSLPVTAFFAVAGHAVLKASGIDEAPLTCWLIAPAVGALCWSGVSFFVLSVVGFHGAIVWTGVIAVIAVGLFALRRKMPTAIGGRGAWLIAILIAALAIMPIFPLLPAIEEGGLYFGQQIFDHVKTALVDSIYRTGLPPTSPFIAPDGRPAGLFYYYGWYVLAAQLRAVFGCSGYVADLALSHVTAISSLALMGAIAYRLSGSCAAIAGVLLIAPAGDPRALLGTLIGWPDVARLEGPEFGIENWLEQSFWVPQHIFAATGVVVAMLILCWLRPPASRIWRLAIMLGAVAAASVTASIYSGAFVFAAIALPAAVLVLWDTDSFRRVAVPLLVAMVIAGSLAAPMLLNLASLGGGPGKIVAFWIYPATGFIDQSTVAGKIAHVVSFWIVLLPLHLGLAYVLGLWQLRRPPAAASSEQFLFWALSIAVILVSFLITQFVKSTVTRNDLGWRIILPALLILTANAGVTVGRWLEGLGQAPINVQARLRTAALLVAAAIAVPLTLLGIRAAAEQFVPADQHAQLPVQVHRVLAAQPAAWREVRARTNPTDLVVSNPKAFDDAPEWGANLPWALFADRSSLLSSANWAALLSLQLQASGIVEDYANLLDRLFAAHATASDVDALAGRLNVRMIVVTPLDDLWANDGTIVGRFERVAEGVDYRLYAPKKSY